MFLEAYLDFKNFMKFFMWNDTYYFRYLAIFYLFYLILFYLIK